MKCSLFFQREKVSTSTNSYKKIKQNSLQNKKGYTLYDNNSTFVSPIYTFSLAGNITVYTPYKGTIGEKYFNHIIYKGKMPTPAGNEHLSIRFFFQRLRLFNLSTENVRVKSVRNGNQSVYLTRRHNNNNIN